MENLEPRVLALEAMILSMNLDALRARLAALENQTWQTTTIGGGGGGVSGIIKAKATSTITKATNANTPGSGTYLRREWNGTAKSDGTEAGTCYSDHDVYVLSGAEITLGLYEDAYWLIDVDQCSHTSATPPVVGPPAFGGGAGFAAEADEEDEWPSDPDDPFMPPF